MLMSTMWMTGAEQTVLKVYAGASHGSLGFRKRRVLRREKVFDDVRTLVDAKLA